MSDKQPALILIVDDDYDFLEINRLILERAGYRVACASEPRQAMSLMEKEMPDLVITDLMMTSVDAGFSLSGAIKADERYANVPIIIATSVSSALGLDFRPRTAEDMATMNVDAYFDKPLQPEALLAKVAALLQRPPEEPGSGPADPAADSSQKDRA
jgi:CheY-like chemotaxis protein